MYNTQYTNAYFVITINYKILVVYFHIETLLHKYLRDNITVSVIQSLYSPWAVALIQLLYSPCAVPLIQSLYSPCAVALIQSMYLAPSLSKMFCPRPSAASDNPKLRKMSFSCSRSDKLFLITGNEEWMKRVKNTWAISVIFKF